MTSFLYHLSNLTVRSKWAVCFQPDVGQFTSKALKYGLHVNGKIITYYKETDLKQEGH